MKANTIFRILRKFWKLPTKEKMILTEAVLLLFLAKLFLFVFPFKIGLKFIQQSKSNNAEIDYQRLVSIKNAIYNANKMAFWKNKCFVMSIAARWMLNRRNIPSKLYIGVAHNKSKKLIAHAWIIADSFEIVNKDLDYKELFSY